MAINFTFFFWGGGGLDISYTDCVSSQRYGFSAVLILNRVKLVPFWSEERSVWPPKLTVKSSKFWKHPVVYLIVPSVSVFLSEFQVCSCLNSLSLFLTVAASVVLDLEMGH